MSDARLLVVSDVHCMTVDLRWILRHETADAMFFLGDGLRDLEQAVEQEKAHGTKVCPVYTVRGNCDAGWPDPLEGLAPFGGVLFFYTHGHAYGVKASPNRLAEAAAERGADVALYGHTHERRHRAVETDGQLVQMFNPGALLRQSYGVIEIHNGHCKFSWHEVP